MASKPIVAGTDGSEESLRAVGWAAREAALRGAPLRIVGTAELLPRMTPRAGATGARTTRSPTCSTRTVTGRWPRRPNGPPRRPPAC